MGLPQVRQCGFRRGLADIFSSRVVGTIEILCVYEISLEVLMSLSQSEDMRKVSHAPSL